MKFKNIKIIVSLISMLALFTGCSVTGYNPVIETKQKIAIPSYFYPGSLWTQMENAYPTIGIAIINPNSGAGDSEDSNYDSQVAKSQLSGLKILGYSHTSYGNRDITDVKKDIDKYYLWYNVDGIFVDEVSTDCNKIGYYTELKDYIKSKDDTGVIVINPGTQTNECYMEVGDIVINFENTYYIYKNKYSQPSWVNNYPPNRFWHLVHTTPNIEKMKNVIQLSKNRNAGWVYVTPDVLSNPWDTLPSTRYWNTELKVVGE